MKRKRKVWIYFARVGGFVKIGVTKNVESRMKALQTMNAAPAEFIGKIKGSPTLEGLLHSYLRGSKVKGEWFEYSKRIPEIIEELKERRYHIKTPDGTVHYNLRAASRHLSLPVAAIKRLIVADAKFPRAILIDGEAYLKLEELDQYVDSLKDEERAPGPEIVLK